ncbi:MAG: Uma2 family endonuclease [Ktedonobacterales bacterium]
MARPASMSRQPDPTASISYEEFLDWADEDTLAEWVDGVVLMASPASVRHQLVATFLQELVTTFVKVHTLGVVLPPPFQMELERSGREPDLLYLADAHRDRMKETYLDGPADLVVEIVSPESAERDRGDKFHEYQDARIPEYWLIDPRIEQGAFYQLDSEGRYQGTPLDTGHGMYQSRIVAGFRLRLEWLWEDPLPDPTHALLEIDREAYAAYLREQMRQAGLE